MKHLIALGLKYVRRQKLRTLLTFLCVTLSVFILSSFGAYCGSILCTMRNKEVREQGLWEADVTPVLETLMERGADPKTLYDIVRNHAVVSSNFIYYCEYAHSTETGGNGKFLELDDGKGKLSLKNLDCIQFSGDTDLMPPYFGFDTSKFKDDGFAVSEFFRDRGYEVGDTLNFTLRTVKAVYDEDSEIMKDIRRELEEKYGTPYTRLEAEMLDLDRKEIRNSYNGSIESLLVEKGIAYEDYPIKDMEYSEGRTYSMKISRFLKTRGEDNVSFARKGEVEPLFAEFTDGSSNNLFLSTKVCINKEFDFDDALTQLIYDLGYSVDDFNYNGPSIHLDLLMLEFRSAAAIANLAGFAVVFAFFLLMFWAVARFVIDNAFEISASERSTQYAALRIMGASKAQIAAVVFTEAVFYIVTAVPIGTISAYALCSMAVNRFNHLGYPDFEFGVNPMITALVVALCVIAVFISAFTSSMWATRKLSPAEALNFGKPKRKKKIRAHKSKLNISSKRFVSRYTRKNIMRSKNRFIIASITMAIGVTLFTSAALTAVVVLKAVNGLRVEYREEDYFINYDGYDLEMFNRADEVFKDEKLFAKADITISGHEFISEENEDMLKTLDQYMKYHYYGTGKFSSNAMYLRFISRNTYEKEFEPLTKLSYDDFVKSGGGFLVSSAYGSPEVVNAISDQIVPEAIYENEAVVFDKPVARGEIEGLKYSLTGTLCYTDFNEHIIFPLDSPIAPKKATEMYIRLIVNGEENYDEAKEAIDDFTSVYKPSWYSDSYRTGTGWVSFLSAIAKTILLLIFSVWAVGVLSMVNSVNTSVLNRSRELMMLRSVGMTRKQLRKTVCQESLMFSSVSSIGGVILGFAAVIGISWVLGFMELLMPAMLNMIIVIAVIIALNIIIALVAAIPGIRSLSRAESLTRAE